jgi:hypothetical protein
VPSLLLPLLFPFVRLHLLRATFVGRRNSGNLYPKLCYQIALDPSAPDPFYRNPRNPAQEIHNCITIVEHKLATLTPSVLDDIAHHTRSEGYFALVPDRS